MSERTRKLVALRSRTDHDLLIVVQREIARGLAAMELATTKSSQRYVQAEKALATATTLLPRIADVSEDDRLRIEGKATELRSRLEQVPVYANVWSFPAFVAS